MLPQFLRYYHTLKYLSAKQWVTRIRRLIRKRIWRLLRSEVRYPLAVSTREITSLYRFVENLPDKFKGEMVGSLRVAEDAADNRFTFLNESQRLSEPINWHLDSVSQLWRYNLHYFHIVESLLILKGAGRSAEAAEIFTRLARSWVDGNRFLVGDGWHPYTLSLRIINWVMALASGIVQPEYREAINRSLYAQARFLADDLEHDVRGNHLFENLRALIIAGTYFDGAEPAQWRSTALSILKVEIKEQILAEGAHFERSPSYHWLLTKEVVELVVWLDLNSDNSAPEWLRSAGYRMLQFGQLITPFDGHEPLLKDSGWNASPDISSVLNVGALVYKDRTLRGSSAAGLFEWVRFGADGFATLQTWPIPDPLSGNRYLKESGYQLSRTKESFFLMDVGRVCPDYLPAHAHADLLSFVLYVGNRRVVVDSGVYEYQSGPWRNYFRSTAAHNTISVNGENQSDVWGSFRVAKRARPTVEHAPVSSEPANPFWIQASHDGYMRLSCRATHRRSVYVEPGDVWLIFDEIETLSDEGFSIESTLHFAPDIEPKAVGNGRWNLGETLEVAVMSSCGGEIKLISGQESPRQGFFSAEFGEIQPNPVLSLSAEGKNVIRVVTIFARQPLNGLSFESDLSASYVRAQVGSREIHCTIPFANTANLKPSTTIRYL